MSELQHKQHNRLVLITIAIMVIAAICVWQQLSKFASGDIQSMFDSAMVTSASLTVMAVAILFVMLRSGLELRKVQDLAYVDELTGLANRRRFNEALQNRLKRSTRANQKLGVMFFDLDRLKTINDCHGHEVGDAVIRGFGDRINSVIRNHDLVARLSGDEFAAIISDAQSEEDLIRISNRILEVMREPIIYKRRKFYAGVSMGAVVINNGEVNCAEAMRMADLALLRSKDQGRGRLQIFDPEMAKKTEEKGLMEANLREAIATDAFRLRYLPAVSRSQSRIVCVEALLRWHHPSEGEVLPSVFIPLAEEIGLIDRLGEFALRKACQDIAPIQDIRLAVNISPLHFLQEGFVEMVKSVLDETGFAAERLELEIAERILMSNADQTKQVLERLRKVGVRVALDNFGTGYSSMTYLQDFALDRIKIDRSFTGEINDNKVSENLVGQMIDLGGTLGLNVTVEGVENEAQLKLLSNSACNEFQGFLFSKPLTASELVSMQMFDDMNRSVEKADAREGRLAG